MKELIEKYKNHRLRVLSLALILLLSLSVLLMVIYTNQILDDYKFNLQNTPAVAQSADDLDDIDSLINSIDNNTLPADDLTIDALSDGTGALLPKDTALDNSMNEVESNLNNPSVLGEMTIQVDQK